MQSLDDLKLIENFINDVKDLKILVIGETIIDKFVDVVYQGESMKSSCPVYLLKEKIESQQGGAAAIKNHLSDFVSRISFLTSKKNAIIKTRYVESFSQRKHVEINKIETNALRKTKIKCKDYDIVIVSDFGHGFCDNLEIDDGFYLMCQTNSNNFGFNRISKWKTHFKKLVCIDKREASLQLNKRIKNISPNDVKELYNYELNCSDLFITIGENGSYFTNGKFLLQQDVLKSDVVDTIGAGDTFFAFACLTSFLNYNDKRSLLIPSLAASLSTTWRCNEESITKEKLLKYAARIL